MLAGVTTARYSLERGWAGLRANTVAKQREPSLSEPDPMYEIAA